MKEPPGSTATRVAGRHAPQAEPLPAEDLAAAFDEFAPLVFALALRVTRNRQAAEEICQDVFFRLWHNRQYDATRGNLRSWLAMTTHGASVDWIRREVSSEQRLIRARTDRDAPDPVEEMFLAADAARATRAAVDRLPEKQRDAVCLAYFDGLSHTEIALATSTPLGTVKSRIRDGMRRLSLLLAALQPETGLQPQTALQPNYWGDSLSLTRHDTGAP